MKNKYFYILIGVLFLAFNFLFLQKWYLFSLDLTFNPNWWLPSWWAELWRVWILSKLFFSLWIPIWLLQKFVILIWLFILWYWTYLILKNTKDDKIILFGLLLVFFNPFFYDRFIDWQLNIWLSYCFYPLFIYLVKQFYEKFSLKYLLWIWFLSLLLNLTSPHNVVFVAVILIIFSIIYFFKYKNIPYVKNVWKLALVVIWLNLFWLIPIFYSNNTFWLLKITENFNQNDFQAFQFCLKDNENIYLKAFELKWYWWECMHRFADANLVWWKYVYTIFLIWLLFLIWIYFRFKKKENTYFDISLLVLFSISFILSLWISYNNIFSPISVWLYNNIKFYRWFREPQKWIMFLVFGYLWFATWWLKYLLEKLKLFYKNNLFVKFLVWIIILSPVFYSFNQLFNFHWQLSIRQYPKQWKEIKNITFNDLNKLNNCEYKKAWKVNKCYKWIVFPWHSYIWIRWIWKKTLIWVSNYFWNNLLLADNIEIWNIYSQSIRPESKIVEKYIAPWGKFRDSITEAEIKDFIKDMKWLWIKYVILLKDADWKFYENFLERAKELWYLKIVKDNEMVRLYKVK